MNVFVSEKGEGTIAGGEGEISFSMRPGETFRYLDGNAEGRAVGLIFTERGIDYKVGDPLDFHDIQVQTPDTTA
jgi:hypothetical protein